MNGVLDASVGASWLLEDAGAGQAYADAVMQALERPGVVAHVPVIFGLELASVMLKAEARGTLTAERTARFLQFLSIMPIESDSRPALSALRETLPLARRYGLSSYDASYLELALRLSLPLATLDTDLRRAARKAGVQVFKP